MYEKKEDPKLKEKPEELAKALVHTAAFYKNKLENVTRREEEAVRSVKRLASNAELDSITDKLAQNILSHGEQKLARIEESMVFVAKAASLALPTQLEETEPEKEAKRLIPKRMFKGSLSMDTFEKLLGEEEYKWYREISEKDSKFWNKAEEILNYMNGERNLHEILWAVSAEYTETKAEHALKFVRDLAKLNLVALQQE